jgi:hypothetical protein
MGDGCLAGAKDTSTPPRGACPQRIGAKQKGRSPIIEPRLVRSAGRHGGEENHADPLLLRAPDPNNHANECC